MNPPAPGLVAEDVDRLLRGTPYRVIKLIGRGGMGQVYEAEHEFLGRRLALKILHPVFAGDPEFADRLRVEAQAMARVRHPGIVEVIDFWFADDGRPCLVMELLQGRTLAAELLERRKLPNPEVAEIGIQVLSVLRATHGHGIVHRDIKPENLFFHEQAGGPRTLKILDFGVARVGPQLASDTAPRLAIPTQTGALIGSPRFMSPEAAAGKRVDARADLYSVGLVLYVALAGRGPFDRDEDVAEPPSYHGGPRVTAGLDAIVLRAIAERIEDRYQTADEFAADLCPLLPAKSRFVWNGG